ncbi:hypothetical protein TTHERM_00530610 (macronuclear) [Tetrahymena thermophila SB210]|uniref:Uncharacterized protein n=1 Tax=Tetrahymena thermophila (strain SB210) TaxID=312017 RepID=I7MCX5_TETTS|nr:hypothetical protein TTHERM_00530610 [Tetrahymena thermophila SB210]EAR85103.1 hypothetical protein TTHERM_00530610 [Tetrahymena thermophila SB210]|eukprot:XP_001032766.1 hypothetical protein TTHERM_00530610 [Tetrahymena thermophila SB210]
MNSSIKMTFKPFEYQLIQKKPSSKDSFTNLSKKINKAKKSKKICKESSQKNCQRDEAELYVLQGNVVIDINTLFQKTNQLNQLVYESQYDGQLLYNNSSKKTERIQSPKIQNTASYFFYQNMQNYGGIISAVEYFKRSDTLEVMYDSMVEGFYLNQFQAVISNLQEYCQKSSQFSNNSQMAALQSQLIKYQEIISQNQSVNDNDAAVRNQLFDVSMKIAHQYLIEINGKQGQIDLNYFPQFHNYKTSLSSFDTEKAHNNQLFFYNGLKRTEYGYSIDRKGLNKNLIDLLNIGEEVLQQVILRKGFINFLTADSNLKLLQFDLESRIILSQQFASKTCDLSSIKGRRISAEIITLDLMYIPCEIVVDLIQISFGNESWSQNYLMLFYIEISESEQQRIKCLREQSSSLKNISQQQQQQQHQQQQSIHMHFQNCLEGINTDILYDQGYSNLSETFINNFYPDQSYQSSFSSINGPN